MPDKFHNPYNFVPTMDPGPAGEFKIDANGQPQNMLGQGRPAGHDRYVPGLWSGRIGVEIVAMTPLLIPEAKPVREVKDGPSKGHKVYRTRRSPGGNPLLPVTSLKGPLRATYEAVTNSRFGVFKGHEELLARRMSPKEALQLVPGRIVRAKSGNGLEVELLMGTTNDHPVWDVQKSEWTLPIPPQKFSNGKLISPAAASAYAAWLPIRRNAPMKNFSLPSGLKHGDPVSVRLQRMSRRQVTLWQVVQMASGHNATSGFVDVAAVATDKYNPQSNASDFLPNAIGALNGYLCKNEMNFERKHDERVFFSSSTAVSLPVAQDVRDQWHHLMLNYKATFKDHGWGFNGSYPSRHLTEADSETLKAGDLCYVKLQRDDDDPARPLVMDLSGRIPIVAALYPVCVSRELGLATPAELLETGLRPAQSLDQLSPADRVFGWARDAQQGRTAGEATANSRPAAYKGQLRIAPIKYVECRSKGQDGKPLSPIAAFGETEIPLAILSTPKPEQTRFYLGKRDPQGRVQPLPNGIDRREAAYARDKVLRGRKVYPHQAAMAGLNGYWQPTAALQDARSTTPNYVGPDTDPRYREYVRRPQHNNVALQDSQNRSIRDWIRPGTVFKTHIDVTNMNQAELGALLWLLDLPHFNRADNGDEGRFFHRIGGGKPLGFGSVIIRLTSLDLSDGCAKAVRYGSLLGALDGRIKPEHRATGADKDSARAAARVFVENFKTAISTTYDQKKKFKEPPFIEAFLSAARGHADLPTHYPRVTPEPDASGENFKWFVANEREGNNGGGLKLSLGALGSDTSLPYEPTRGAGGGNQSRRGRDRPR